ncbi:MAG: glycine amidinotransferase [bacterium]
MSERPVNVYTEWGPLREVVLGSCVNFNLEGFDDVFVELYHETLRQIGGLDAKPEIHRRYTEERQEDLDAFARTLEELGVRVRRPKRLDEIVRVKTPHFEAITNAVDAPRDMFLCLGDEILETPPTNRNRYFEGLMLRELFLEYFRRGARWTLGPRPALHLSLDRTRWREVDRLHEPGEIEPELEICFDAANCLKFGRDLLMNVGNKNHELGALWLQRHLGDRFRVHPVRVTDYHIDGTLIPLRPGVLLVNPTLRRRAHWLPEPLRRWKQIEVEDEPRKRFDYPADHVQLASFTGMGLNVLSVDERRVCVRDEDHGVRRALEAEGFEVIPVRFRHCELFGGGLHCCTLDVRRDEALEDHFT